MSTTSKTDAKADLETLCESLYLRRPLDPALARRVKERADKVREELIAKGQTDVSLALLREIRDE